MQRPGPAISVVIPVRNGAATITAQLEALAHQRDPPEFEVVVALDQCTDATASIVAAFGERLDIRTVEVDHPGGVARARNQGVRLCAADRIAHSDADDIVDASWVRAMYGALDQHELVVGSNRLLAEGALPGAATIFEHEGPPFLLGVVVTLGNNVGYRRRVFDDVGGFPEDFDRAQDVAFGLEALHRGYRIHHEASAVVHTRMRGSWHDLCLQRFKWGLWHARLIERYLPDERRPLVREVLSGIHAVGRAVRSARAAPASAIVCIGERLGRSVGAMRLAVKGRWPWRSASGIASTGSGTRLVTLPPDAPVIGGLLVRIPTDQPRSVWNSEADRPGEDEHFEPGTLVIDCSAGIGIRSIRAAVAVGDSGRVVSVLADHQTRQCFEDNVRRAGVSDRVTAVDSVDAAETAARDWPGPIRHLR